MIVVSKRTKLVFNVEFQSFMMIKNGFQVKDEILCLRAGFLSKHVVLVGQATFAELHRFLCCLVEKICGFLKVLFDAVSTVQVNLSYASQYAVGGVAFGCNVVTVTGSVVRFLVAMLFAEDFAIEFDSF